MKTIRFLLEYSCLPIWIYDENGDPCGPMIPDELIDDHELVSLVHKISEEYDALFENTETIFQYIGFTSDREKQEFFDSVERVIDITENKVGALYYIKNDIDINEFN